MLEGEVTLRAGGEEHVLEPGVFARVGPDERRHLFTGEQPGRGPRPRRHPRASRSRSPNFTEPSEAG